MISFRACHHSPRRCEGTSPRYLVGFLRRSDEGTAALELALLAPILILLLMGILELGYAFYVKNTLTNAVREGARAGVTVPPLAEPSASTVAQNTVTSYLNQTLSASMAGTVRITMVPPNTTTAYMVVNAVIPDYHNQTPFNLLPGNLLPNQIAAQAVMRWEWAAPGT